MAKHKKQWQDRITPRLFEYCISEIKNYNSADDYAFAIINSPIWDIEMVYKDGRDEWLKNVWSAYHRTLSEVVEYSGLSKAAFYRYFGIPRRTFQDWVYGVNTVPIYTLFMMQEILGLVTRF